VPVGIGISLATGFRCFVVKDNNGDLLSEGNGFLDEVFGSAGRFIGSRAVEDDVAIPGNLSVAVFDLFHSDTVQRMGSNLYL